MNEFNGFREIEMPTQSERLGSISVILEHAPKKPCGYFREIIGLIKIIGVRGLFFGVVDAAFLAITAAIIIGAWLMAVSQDVLYSVMFFTSPLTYVLLYSLVIWKESFSGTRDLHKTLEISADCLSAVRMLFFGVFSMAVNGFISAFAVFGHSYRNELQVSFMRLLEISFCSLFVFASILLFILLKFRSNKAQIAFIAAWCIGGAVTVIPFDSLLKALPPLALSAITVMSAVVFIIESKIFYRRRKYYVNS